MRYKTCLTCNVERLITEYESFPTKSGEGKRRSCNYCRKEYKKEKAAEIKEWYYNYKMSLRCEVCGYSNETHETFAPQALEFHHPQKNKDFAISTAVANAVSIKTIKKEISKCVVLCNRCHTEIHNT